jgi:uroporphyrin-III C-methyltransferase/precorrin-2 dehydrogenase/sirohydrochlorin ferrochelatase/uroporphyrin-III C-methyltransferase
MPPAKIYLVGAGPGDPELLTVKAMRLISEAAVVVFDRLVSDEILARIPEGTDRIFVGKAPQCHYLAQEEINNLLITLAQAGQTVVRLKGGDPFIFGRGGEEAEALRAHGIPVEIVPGISAAAGCAAAIGIPLTHRDLATGVRFVTGHRRNGLPLDLNWKSLADQDTTLVVYMGLKNFPEIADQLISAGLSPTTPVVAISSGSMPDQKICAGLLGELPMRLPMLNLRSPVLFVIGKVVALSDWLSIDRARSTEESFVNG